MLDNPNACAINNFEGTLDADSCSLESLSQDDSEMETLSDIELTESSDEDISYRQSIIAEGSDSQGVCGKQTATLKTDNMIAMEQIVHQQTIREDNVNNIICNNQTNNTTERSSFADRSRTAAPATPATTTFEEEESFKAEEGKMSKLGQVTLLQNLSLISSDSSTDVHVVDHHCNQICGCMRGMYFTTEYNTQNNF